VARCVTPDDPDDKKRLPVTLVVGAGALVAFALAVIVTLIRRKRSA
jgi:hypothetical protein